MINIVAFSDFFSYDPDGAAVDISVANLVEVLQKRGIPLEDVNLVYAGCGTHEVAIEYDDGQPEPPPPLPEPDDPELTALGF